MALAQRPYSPTSLQAAHLRRTDNLTVLGGNRWRTDELLALLSVLTGCVSLEPAHCQLPDQVCDGPLISTADLQNAGIQLAEGNQRMGRQRADQTLFAD